MANLHEFQANALDGKLVSLDRFRGEVVLVVNTASQCGFTPQYAGLEKLQQAFHGRGFDVLGFPCNQFGRQEPGDAGQIGAFCEKNYGVSFPMFEKIDVNGEKAHPVYQWLTGEAPGFLGSRSIKWNFTKFLVGRDGNVIRRYATWTKPESIAADIDKLLG